MNDEKPALIKQLRDNAKLSFSEIGKIFGFTKQRAWTIYNTAPDNSLQTQKKRCELCGKKKDISSYYKNTLILCNSCASKLPIDNRQ